MRKLFLVLTTWALLGPSSGFSEDVKQTDVYRRLKKAIDSVRAIHTLDHLRPFDQIAERNVTDQGRDMSLESLWRGSYYGWTNPLSPWMDGESFESWWSRAKTDFDDARVTSFYRYLLPAFRDLYGVDFETMTDAQASQLNKQMFENYKSDIWLNQVITERADIEVMFFLSTE